MTTITSTVSPALAWYGEPPGTAPATVNVAAGAQVVLLATIAPGSSYVFVKWTEGGVTVHTNRRYIFTAGADRTLVAHFTWAFQYEIDQVDATKLLVPIVDTVNYGSLEFSYSGLTVTGGSVLACEYAASELLEAMGFRWYTPAPWGTVRPISISISLTRPKGKYWFENNAMFLTYGNSWIDCLPPSTSGFGRQKQWDFDLEDRHKRHTTLNSFREGVYPTGHRWLDVISGHLNWLEAIGTEGVKRKERLLLDWTKLPAPYGLNTAGNNTAKWNLDPAHLTPAEYNEIVTICAADLLRAGRNVTTPRNIVERIFTAHNKTHFDPADGDLNISNWVYPFTKAVATMMRAGTPAIDNIPAQAPQPGLQLGIYAYAQHRLPPNEPASATPPGDYKPGVFTRVAIAFNKTGLTYGELIHEHGLRCDFILIREYWDTQLWSLGMPMRNGLTKKGAFEKYDAWHAQGVLGATSEFTENWLANIVMMRYVFRKCKTGIATYETALDDIMTHLFQKPGGGEDPAVRALYGVWSNKANKFNKFTLRQSFDKADAMVASWYKTLFQQYLIICYKREYLPPKITSGIRAGGASRLPPEEGVPYNTNWPNPMPGDPFPAAFTSYMGNVVAMSMKQVIHSFAQMQADAQTAVSLDYPYLSTSFRNNTVATNIPGYPTGNYDPEYQVNPIEPIIGGPNDEWGPAYAELLADTPHDTDLDDDDLVLVRGITPVIYGYTPEKYPDIPSFSGRYTNSFAFIGPGTVTHTDTVLDDVYPETYGPGLHFIETPTGNYCVTTNVGGELFLDTFLGCYVQPLPAEVAYFLYVHGRTQEPPTDPTIPAIRVESVVRWSFYDDRGTGTTPERLDLPPPDHGNWPAAFERLQDLGPGQVGVVNVMTQGIGNNTSLNRWMSKKGSLVLLPRAIAEEDFPNRARVKVVA